MKYADKLKDVRWQKRRLEILQRDEFMCKSCFANEESAAEMEDTLTLHVHHMYYEGNRDPWDYPNESLVTLCSECHDEQTKEFSNAAEWACLKAMKHKGFLVVDFKLLAKSFNSITADPRMIAFDYNWAIRQCIERYWVRRLVEEVTMYNKFDRAREIVAQLEAEHIQKEMGKEGDEVPA
jgi:hypothetical protein